MTAAVEVELSHGLAHAQGHAILLAPSVLETVKTAARAFLVIIIVAARELLRRNRETIGVYI